MQHGICAIGVADALPRCTSRCVVCTTCALHALVCGAAALSAAVRHASACNEHVVHLGSINARCTPAQEQRDTVSTSSASWQSGARVAVAVTGDAGLMAEAPSSGLSSAVCRLGLGAWGLRWAMAMAVGRPPRQAASGRCRRALGEQIAFRICNVFHHGRNVTRQVCTSMFDRAVEIV